MEAKEIAERHLEGVDPPLSTEEGFILSEFCLDLLTKNAEIEGELAQVRERLGGSHDRELDYRLKWQAAEQQVKELREGLLFIATQSIHAFPNSEATPGTAIWMKKKAQEILTNTEQKE